MVIPNLVNIQKTIENCPVEIVDLPINSMVFHSFLYTFTRPGRWQCRAAPWQGIRSSQDHRISDPWSCPWNFTIFIWGFPEMMLPQLDGV